MPGRAKTSKQSSQVASSQRGLPLSQRNVDPEESMIIEDSQDEIAPSQAVSQARRALSSISPDIVDKKVYDLVQYLLIMERKKYPVKRLDINKMVLKEHSKGFMVFMEKAKKVLKDVFGLDLVEIDNKTKCYILVNALDPVPEMPIGLPNEEKAKMGLVMTILSVIFMKGNVIDDDELYRFLMKLGVDIQASHAVFGDVKKLITIELVRQGYLDFQRQRNSDPPSYEIRWGPRAKHELTKGNALKFVSQEIFQQQDPSIWTDQFQDAHGQNE